MPTVVQNQVADRVGVSGPITFFEKMSSNTMSPWFALDGIRPWSVTVRWASVNPFTVRLYVTNNPHPVEGDTSEPQLGEDITEQAALAFETAWKFVAAQLVTLPNQPPDVSAYLLIG